MKDAQQVLNTNRATVDSQISEKRYVNENNYYKYEDEENSSRTSGYSSDYAKKMFLQNKPKENSNVEYSKYRTGVKVKHVKFGLGTIINVKGEGDNIIVNVAFNGVGIKMLSVKYAPMEIV